MNSIGCIVFNSIFVCGDSFAYGQELDESIREKKNFPSLIAQHFNLPVYNHSIPGGSNSRILRVSFVELPKLVDKKPFVIIPWSQPHRMEFWNVKANDFKMLHPPPGADNEFTRLYFEEHTSESSEVLRTLMAKISLQHLLKSLGFNYLFVEMFDVVPPTPKQYKHLEQLIDRNHFLPDYLGWQYNGCPMAPGGHPLEEGHKKMADYLINEIEKHENNHAGL